MDRPRQGSLICKSRGLGRVRPVKLRDVCRPHFEEDVDAVCRAIGPPTGTSKCMSERHSDVAPSKLCPRSSAWHPTSPLLCSRPRRSMITSADRTLYPKQPSPRSEVVRPLITGTRAARAILVPGNLHPGAEEPPADAPRPIPPLQNATKPSHGRQCDPKSGRGRCSPPSWTSSTATTHESGANQTMGRNAVLTTLPLS